MKTIFSHTIIKGTPDMVWSVLADFDRYPYWNPVVVRVIGEPKIHASLHISLDCRNGPASHTMFV